MPDIHGPRRDRLRQVLADRDAPAVLVTGLVNVRYLSGFTGSHGALLITPDKVVLATDGRYDVQAAQQAPDVELVLDRVAATALATRAAKEGLRRLAFEEHNVTVEQYATLRDAAAGVELVQLGRSVEQLRQIKDEHEIGLIREACAISDRALAELLDSILFGRTERHIAQELERRMLDHGADGPAFETIVASGPNSAIPHHRPTDRRVEEGDFLKVDFGALFHGYHADMTRTFVVGGEPAPWQIELHELVFAAQKAGREALAPGVELAEVERAARSVIEAAGYGERFTHSLGHGVGLQVHEDPFIRLTSTGKLAARMPVTVEPGVYLPGRGGVRIEDTLVVRDAEDGGPELLTITTKELLVL